MERKITNWHATAQARRTFGDKAADALRNGMGSWLFVGLFILFMCVWALLNTVAPFRWDVYPFILLNLFLSMLAGLQGAILLIAAKRQDALSAALAEHDYTTNVSAKAELEALTKLTEEQGAMLKQLLVRLGENPVR